MGFSSQSSSLFEQNNEHFDFNLHFELVFMSIIPSALFVLAALWRTISLSRKAKAVDASVLRLIKLV